MLEVFREICDRISLAVPAEARRPIGIVGAGAIVDVAHLPAYASAGLEVTCIFDIDQARAEAVAARHGVPRVARSLDELLGADDVEVVDIAVSPKAQPDVLRRVLSAGHDVLCQKPFAPDLGLARELIEEVEASGRTVAVNQQLRFEESMAAARAMVAAGWVGEPITITFDVDIWTDWSAWPWILESERLDLTYHSIHYLDATRAFLGEPERVFCATSRQPGQVARGESRTMSTLVYADDVRVLLHVHHNNRFGPPRAVYQVDGAHGRIQGTLGLLYDYPHGRPCTLRVWSEVLPTDGWLTYPVTTRWVPHAFVGPMRSLLEARATGGVPETHPRANFGTLALVEALYRSAASGQAEVPDGLPGPSK